jgi:hypothetical protein
MCPVSIQQVFILKVIVVFLFYGEEVTLAGNDCVNNTARLQVIYYFDQHNISHAMKQIILTA